MASTASRGRHSVRLYRTNAGSMPWPGAEEVIARFGRPPQPGVCDGRFELILGRGVELDREMLSLVREACEQHQCPPGQLETPMVTDFQRPIGNSLLVQRRPGDRIVWRRPRGSHDRPNSFRPVAVDRPGEPTSVLSLSIYAVCDRDADDLGLWAMLYQAVRGEMPRMPECEYNFGPRAGRYAPDRDPFWTRWAYASDMAEWELGSLDRCPWKQA